MQNWYFGIVRTMLYGYGLTAEQKKKIGQTQKIGSVARENTSLKMRLVARIIGLHI